MLRELKRNANADGDYHADMARGCAAERARRPIRFRLPDHPMTEDISDWLEQGWRPKLIWSWLTEQFPGDKLRQVSPETICRCLYVQSRGSLRADRWEAVLDQTARKPENGWSGAAIAMPRQYVIAQRPREADDPAMPHGFTKGTNVGVHTPADGRKIQNLLNGRPRPTLDLQTPTERLAELLEQVAGVALAI